MPSVAIIDGVKILFYHDEHPPAHFHARYGEHEAVVELETLHILKGALPPAQLRKVRDWARSRQSELLRAWIACRSDADPGKTA
jgi:Domain of unknown function (DUF4160)